MNVYHKGAIPFVLLLIPYLLGIAMGISFPFIDLTGLYFGFGAALTLFIVLNWVYAKWTYKANWLGGILLFILLIITGAANFTQNKQLNHTDHFSHQKSKYLLVKITDEPIWKNDALKFTAVAVQTITGRHKQQAGGKLLVTIKDEVAKSLYYGDVLLIPAKYREVDPPFNPAEFNYKQYLANKNVYHQAYLYPKQYTVVQHGQGNPVIHYALRLRQTLVSKLKTHLHYPDAAAVASTLILGYKAELSSEVLQSYSKTGTIHVLSVSGAHVGLVYLVLAFVLSFLNRYRHGRLIRAVIIIALVWFYALLTGFSPPVCRAAVMLSLIITGKTYSRHISSLNILAFSALAMLLIDPLLISDVGFQLSYLAVAGLITLQPIIYKQLIINNIWIDKLWLVCSASIAAQVITFPLSAYYFHQVPVYFLLSNLFILLPSSVILCGGIVYLLLPQDMIITRWLGALLEQVILFTNKGLSIIEQMPFASINKVWLTRFEYLLLYGIILIAFIYIYQKRSWLVVCGLILFAIFSSLVVLKHYRAASTSQMVFFNLRKNTGMAFRNGDKAVVITNLQPGSRAYSWSVQPYLDSSKVSNVQIITPYQDITTTFLNKQGEEVTFLKQRIIIAGTTSGKPAMRPYPRIIYYSRNIVPGAEILRNFKHKGLSLVVDGSSGKHSVSYMAQLSKQLNIPLKILSGNKAFIVTSN